MAKFLLEDQPVRALLHQRVRHATLNAGDRFIDHLLRVRARRTRVLRGAKRHRQRVRGRLDQPFDPAPVGFAFPPRLLQQRLKVAERRKVRLSRLLDRLQKRPHELAFQRVHMQAPLDRGLLDPGDLIGKTEVTTPFRRRPS